MSKNKLSIILIGNTLIINYKNNHETVHLTDKSKKRILKYNKKKNGVLKYKKIKNLIEEYKELYSVKQINNIKPFFKNKNEEFSYKSFASELAESRTDIFKIKKDNLL